MAMWVWRLSASDDGTVPNGWADPPARHWDCINFQIGELFNSHDLTQGWGIPGLDLNLNEPDWVRNRLEWSRVLGEHHVTIKGAEKEYALMIPIKRDIRIKDIIFVPKVGQNCFSEDHFTVVTVAGNYRFDPRGPFSNTWRYCYQQGFGHIIPVNSDRTRVFHKNELQSGAFGAPFLKRVNSVPRSAYRGFDDFLRRHNYPFNPY